MNREVKFRGKRKLNGDWVYGSLISIGNDWCQIVKEGTGYDEIQNNMYRIISETASQFIGLHGKDGKKIYAGDILTGWKKGSNSDRGYTGVVQWMHDQAGWVIKCDKYVIEILSLAQSGWSNEPYNVHQLDSFHVIGNIYDNPELLNKTL